MWNDFSEYIINYLSNSHHEINNINGDINNININSNESSININNDSINSANENNNDNKLKVAEIGIGNFFQVANNIEDSGVDIIKIDINPQIDTVIYDDIKNFNINLYWEVGIIYSIRPPYELHCDLIKLAKTINASLIIKPLTNEFIDSKLNMNLINYKKVSFYQYP
ncbi:MAG: UPF0146 family protein [Methanobacteriaceae archaeon]